MFSWSAFYLGLFSFYPIKGPLIRGRICDLTVSFFSIWPVLRSKFLKLIYFCLLLLLLSSSPVTGLFFPVLLLNQRWSLPLRLQASHCSTFRIMCDVPSIAVFCSESIECFPGTASKVFLKLLVTIPVAPIIIGTSIIIHFRFHIRFISIPQLLYYYYYNFKIIIICVVFYYTVVISNNIASNDEMNNER